MTSEVSKIGISRTSTGAATIEITSGRARLSDCVVRVAALTVKPSNRLPLSPMKIDAGWKL